MKSKILIVAGELLAVLFLAGCVSKSSNFEIPPPKVELKANPTVKISTVGDAAMLKGLAAAIGAEFTKHGGKVADTNPDYWIVIYGVQDKRVDTPEDNKHNIIFSKTVQKDANGGEEFLVSRQFTTAANAHFISVVLYEVKTLTPIVNMDFPFYSSSIVDGAKSTKLRSDKSVAASFVRQMNRIIFNDGSDAEDPDANPKRKASAAKKAKAASGSIVGRGASGAKQAKPASNNAGAASGSNVGGALLDAVPKMPFGR